MRMPLYGKCWIGGILIAFIASCLFAFQGGFGGGDGVFVELNNQLGAVIKQKETEGLAG